MMYILNLWLSVAIMLNSHKNPSDFLVKHPFWMVNTPIDCNISHKDVEFPCRPIGAMIKSVASMNSSLAFTSKYTVHVLAIYIYTDTVYDLYKTFNR